MNDILAQVLAKVSPSPTNSNHDALPILADGTDKEFCGRCLSSVVKVIQFHAAVLRLVGMG